MLARLKKIQSVKEPKKKNPIPESKEATKSSKESMIDEKKMAKKIKKGGY